MIKKGFTILETMVSVGILSVLMIIVFTCWTEFQKVSLKSEGKQDTNITFVNVYRNIDKIVSSSSVRLFRYYGDDYLGLGNKNLRWFAFMLSRNGNQLDGLPRYEQVEVGSNNKPKYLIYNTCVLYLLHTPNDSCEGGFDNCPHKSLRRYVFPTEEINFKTSGVLARFRDNIIKGQVNNILINPNSATFSVIENNIVDLKLHKESDKVQFFLRIMRINDAERHIKIGSIKLTDRLNPETEYEITDEATRNYIENLSWISIPSNT